MRLFHKVCLIAATLLLSPSIQAEDLSEALLLPENEDWQQVLVSVLPPGEAVGSTAPTSPRIEQFELGIPGEGRMVGKVVFDRPIDFGKQSLNLYFDLDDNVSTGRPDKSHQGVDLMLSFHDGKESIVVYSADGTPSPGHFRSLVDGNVLWFTFQIPDGFSSMWVRAYALSQQKGMRSFGTGQGRVIDLNLTMGGLKIEPLFKAVSLDLPEPAVRHIPENIREALALSFPDDVADVVFEDRIHASTANSSPVVKRVSAMHLGESRIFFQIDTDRSLATTGESLVIYLDADNDPETGRSDRAHKGVDLMVVLGNNGTSVNSLNNALDPQRIHARARQDDLSIYVVLDVPQLNMDENDEVAMIAYVVSQGKGKSGSVTPRVSLRMPTAKRSLLPLPALEDDVLNSAGYRYLKNRVAYESLDNKGTPGGSIPKTGYQPVREVPLPKFMEKSPVGGKGPKEVSPSGVEVTVEEDAGIARPDAVIRFGFPLPKGEFFSVSDIAIADANGKTIPSQIQATALWPDGSFRWLAIQLRDDFKPSEVKTYQVLLGKNIEQKRMSEAGIEIVEEPHSLKVSTGVLRAVIDLQHFAGLDQVEVRHGGEWQPVARAGDGLVIVDEEGAAYSTANGSPSSVTFEEKTAERVTIRLAGDYVSKEGKPYMSYVWRLTFHADSSRVDMVITHINTRLETEFSDFRSLDYDLRLSSPIEQVQVLTFDAESKPQIIEGHSASLRQMTDRDANLSLDGKAETGGRRLPGVVRLKTQDGGSLSLAVTDFWQRWPKGIQADGESLKLELLPPQPSPDFGKDLPYYLMYPLVDGYYRLKWGMAFTERVSLDFGGVSEVAALWAEAQQPLIAVVPVEWYAETGALIPLAVPEGAQFSLWDEYISNSLDAHLESKDQLRLYGFLNYGDWFGERGRNWGNNEYDLPHALFSQFARTGDRRFYRAALTGARHQADSDIVHAYPDPYYVGANHQHSIGHTGQWSQNYNNATWSYTYDGHTAAGNGHTWADGMVDAWVVGVDPVVMESALKLGDHMVYAFAPKFTELGTHERSAGWSMRALMAMYRGTGDPVYLEAADRIGQVTLNAQDKEKTGVWPHELPRGHAGGRVGLHGNNVFLIGILVNGLASYHAETGDPKYEESIILASRWLKNGWDRESGGWPYSITVDGTGVGSNITGLNPLIYKALLYGAILDGDDEGIDAAEGAMLSTFEGKSVESFGKNISFKGFFTPEALGLLQQYYRETGKEGGEEALSMSPATRQRYLQQLPLAKSFSVRSPNQKVFRVQSEGPATVHVSRSRFGAMAAGRNSGTIRVADASGETVFEENFKTGDDRSFEVEIPSAGEWTITIDDERNAVWDVSSSQARVASKVLPRYSIGGVARRRFYFDVPEGTEKFSVRVLGIHLGTYGAAILNPEGVVRADINGDNNSTNLLEDNVNLSDSSYRSAVADITIEVKPEDWSGPWSLILWAQGDIGVQLSGIPPYLYME